MTSNPAVQGTLRDEAVEGCLSVDVKDVKVTAKDKVLEIAV